MNLSRTSRWLSILLTVMLAACQTPAAVQPTATLPPVPTEEPTPTVPPVRSLTVCLGQEPETLYLYGGSSRAMWSVLEAVYDGPIDTRNYAPRPVILQKLPALADGDAALQAVPVQAGDVVVDAGGALISLAKGARVLPSGCSGAACAIEWDGVSALQMDRMVVDFRLLPGLKWSDGQPLTAADSVFSYQVAADPATKVNRTIVDRTEAYEALDDLTTRWVGVPGYLTDRYAELFFSPLPGHILQGTPAADLPASPAAEKPLGWGAYRVDEWVRGDHIALSKNPNYFRADQALPYFDRLVFRFLGEQADNNLEALLAGECDVIDSTSLLAAQLESVLTLQNEGKLKAYVARGPEYELVDFGIRPASYDDGYNPAGGDRPDLFGDVRVRQAFAYCMNRQGLIDNFLFGQSAVPQTLVPPENPQFNAEAAQYPFDVEKGSRLLDEAGWKDTDGDSATPRVAQGAAGVPDGTPLSIEYLTTETPLRKQAADYLARNLAQCGVQLNVKYRTAAELYAPGPDGVLFGRRFDLAQFAWSAGRVPACHLYMSSEIPSAANDWLGTRYGGANMTGYSNPAYDAACEALLQPGLDSAMQLDKSREVQAILAEELPFIPLYYNLKLLVTRPNLCGVEVDASARSDLWNLEEVTQYCP